MKHIQARIPEQDYERLLRISKERGIGFSELVRRLLSKALAEEHHEKI